MADATRRVSVRLSLDDAARVKAGLREVGETGQRSLNQIKGGAERASRSLNLLNAAMRGIQIAGVAVAARSLVQAGDALTQSLFRLQNATGSIERAGQVYEGLYRTALQTGVAVSESVAAFQRFSIAARNIGATSEQVARLVGGLQRTAIISGASAQEISSATLQLAQALASGVLQGDELRSILEAMPLLADGLARELGVSVGELRKLGSEGKLTAELVFPALLRATERIGAELDRAPLSLGRAFGQLTAATENFLGQLDRAIGLSNALARGLSAAASAFDGIRQGAGLLTEEERLADLRRQADQLAAQIGRLESEGGGSASLRAPSSRSGIRAGLAGIAEQQAGVDRAGQLAELRRDYFSILAEIDAAERESLNRRLEEQERAGQAAADARRRRAAQDIQELTRNLDARFRINQEYEERTRRLREAEAAGAVSAAERTRLETLALQERDEALRRLEPRVAAVRRASTEGAREARDTERELNDLLRERERLIQNNETAYERYQRRLERLGDLAQRAESVGQAIPAETIGREAQRALEELEEAERRLQRNTEDTREAAQDLGLAFSSAFEDAIVKGKNLRDTVRGLGEDIARIIVRRTITEPIANAVSSINFGSIFSGLFGGASVRSASGNIFLDGKVVPFAAGGVVERSTVFPLRNGGIGLMGEAGPEAILPLARDSAGRLGVRSQGGGGGNMVFNVSIDARGADAGVEQRIRVGMALAVQEAQRQLVAAVERGGSISKTFGRRA